MPMTRARKSAGKNKGVSPLVAISEAALSEGAVCPMDRNLHRAQIVNVLEHVCTKVRDAALFGGMLGTLGALPFWSPVMEEVVSRVLPEPLAPLAPAISGSMAATYFTYNAALLLTPVDKPSDKLISDIETMSPNQLAKIGPQSNYVALGAFAAASLIDAVTAPINIPAEAGRGVFDVAKAAHRSIR
jgi:hypothetical protein